MTTRKRDAGFCSVPDPQPPVPTEQIATRGNGVRTIFRNQVNPLHARPLTMREIQDELDDEPPPPKKAA